MFKIIFIIGVLISSKITFCQSFYIDAKDKYSVNQISEKLTSLGFTISDSLTYDYKISLTIRQTSKINSMYKGRISIYDNTGKKINESKEVRRGAVAANGFNASYNIAKVIARDYLEKLTSGLKQ